MVSHRWIGVLVLVAACGSSSPSGSGVSEVVLEAPKTVTSGLIVSLKATVQGAASNKNVTWSASGGGRFLDASANPAAFIAPTVSVATTVQVKAIADADPRKAGTAEIQVQPAPPLLPRVNPAVVPSQPSLPAKDGSPVPLAASRDEDGIVTEFIVGQLLIRPRNENDLSAFLQRYDGRVVGDNSVPPPPASLGITLSPEQMRATEYLAQINLAKVDLSTFPADAAMVGIGGPLDFSSEDGLRSMAAATNALATGFAAAPNFVAHPTVFPSPLLLTQERADGKGGFIDAFTATPDWSRFWGSGSQANVTLAWQFVSAHGVQRRVRVAVIDGGFWLNTNGTPRGNDFDLPGNPIQYDFGGDDFVADGPNLNKCGGNPCYWHGNGSVGVATGLINNQQGAAGTGGLVADPLLFRVDGSAAQRNRAISTAVAWGADVVSMSLAYDCSKLSCRKFDRENTPFDDAVNGGSRVVFVAAAGNDGYDVGDPHFVHPCIEDHVLCVGALADDMATRIGYSNYGGAVGIFAPTDIPVMSAPALNDMNPAGPAGPQLHNGTSAATPFVAGIAAMVKAIDPSLNTDAVAKLLRDTAHVGASPVDRYVDAYAAVRAAAQGRPGVSDRFEPNGSADVATTLPPGTHPNLSLHTDSDHDFYRLNVSAPSRLSIDLVYPDTLGQPRIGDGYGMVADQLGCGDFREESWIPRSNGTALSYLVPTGSYLLEVSGKLNAYNLAWSAAPLAPPIVLPDHYEPNNDFSHATSLSSGSRGHASITADDVDFFRFVSFGSGANKYITFSSGFRIERADVPLTLTLFDQNGAQVGQPVVGSADCQSTPVIGNLPPGTFYVKVAATVPGTRGEYQISAGTAAKGGIGISHDRLYQLVHPGDPVEGLLKSRYDGYLFTHTPAVSTLFLVGAKPLHVQLLDEQGTVLKQGTPFISDSQQPGERLDLGGLAVGGDYLVQISRSGVEADPAGGVVPPVSYVMSWGSQQPRMDSGNLIRNGDGDESNQPSTPTGAVVELIGWMRPAGSSLTVVDYNTGNPDTGFVRYTDPGPDQRGHHLFAGGPDNDSSSADQFIDVGRKLGQSYLGTIDAGKARFVLSGYLGGVSSQHDLAVLTATFLDAGGVSLGQAALGPVTEAERDGASGLLFRQEDGPVPVGTRIIQVHLELSRSEGTFNDGYADNLEFRLLDFGS
jgi:hypothetical protein